MALPHEPPSLDSGKTKWHCALVRAAQMQSIRYAEAMKFSLLLVLTLVAAADDPGFVPIFNGKDLNGWTIRGQYGPGYIVEGGKIVCPADGGGNLFTEKEYSNFILRFEFRLQDASNNGIGIRAPYEGDAAYSGMEIQILDHDAAVYRGQLKPAQYHGSIYDVVPAKTGYLKKTGEWNQEEIVADGRLIKVILNGTVIVDANLDDVKDPAVLKKHPGLARTSGHIGLLGHHSRVDFRNLRVKEL
jgi:Domain of Unknown Function (DUF1080)